MRRIWLPFVLTACVCSATAVRADIFKPGIQDQIKLGQKAAAQVRAEEKILPDSDPRVIELRRIGRELVALIPAEERKKRPFAYTFDVIDSDEINAFALPGGPIFLYTGLLDRLESEDQVAGILGHELIHIRNQHWASAYADNQKRQLGLLLILTLVGANSTVFDIAGVTDTLLFTLPYSRKHETEADRVGYDLVAEAEYTPQGMADVFQILKEEGGSARTEEWLSTHPDADRRIGQIENRIASSNSTYPTQRPRSKSVIWRVYVARSRAVPIMR